MRTPGAQQLLQTWPWERPSAGTKVTSQQKQEELGLSSHLPTREDRPIQRSSGPVWTPSPAEASPPVPSSSEELDLSLSRPFSLILCLSQCDPCKQRKVGSCQVSSFLNEPSDFALEVTVHVVRLISTMFGLVFCLGICSPSFWFLLSCHLWMNLKYVLVFHFVNLKKKKTFNHIALFYFQVFSLDMETYVFPYHHLPPSSIASWTG